MQDSGHWWFILHLGDFVPSTVHATLSHFYQELQTLFCEDQTLSQGIKFVKKKKVYYKSAFGWLQKFCRRIKYSLRQVKHIFYFPVFLKKSVCSPKVFIFHVPSTEFYVRFFWGFREKYDSTTKELTDCARSLFSNTFRSLRAHVIILHSLNLNRVSKVTKEIDVLLDTFDDAFVVYIRRSWCLIDDAKWWCVDEIRIEFESNFQTYTK